MGITRWIRAWELCAQDLATQTLENTKTLQETTEQIKSIEVVSTEKQTQVNVGETTKSTKEIIEKTTTTKVIEKEKEKQIETGESEDDNTANSSDLSSEEESTSSE